MCILYAGCGWGGSETQGIDLIGERQTSLGPQQGDRLRRADSMSHRLLSQAGIELGQRGLLMNQS